MLKVLTVLFLIAFGHITAASLSCESCGIECVPACGTRRFRICCFNHLKRKRSNSYEMKIPDYPELDVHKVIVLELPEKNFQKELNNFDVRTNNYI